MSKKSKSDSKPVPDSGASAEEIFNVAFYIVYSIAMFMILTFAAIFGSIIVVTTIGNILSWAFAGGGGIVRTSIGIAFLITGFMCVVVSGMWYSTNDIHRERIKEHYNKFKTNRSAVFGIGKFIQLIKYVNSIGPAKDEDMTYVKLRGNNSIGKTRKGN